MIFSSKIKAAQLPRTQAALESRWSCPRVSVRDFKIYKFAEGKSPWMKIKTNRKSKPHLPSRLICSSAQPREERTLLYFAFFIDHSQNSSRVNFPDFLLWHLK